MLYGRLPTSASPQRRLFYSLSVVPSSFCCTDAAACGGCSHYHYTKTASAVGSDDVGRGGGAAAACSGAFHATRLWRKGVDVGAGGAAATAAGGGSIAVTPSSSLSRSGASSSSGVHSTSRGGSNQGQASKTDSTTSSMKVRGTPGKQKRTPGGGSAIKVRPRAPWGLQQLRDSWSEDAMTKRETENLSERTHRAYRYHPEEFRRYYLKYAAFLTLPCIFIGVFGGYYFHTGQPLWKGDPQELLNYLRSMDTSPRSDLYAFKMREHDYIPDHIVRYREANMADRHQREEAFRVTHTAFRKPTDEEMRQIWLLREEEGGTATEMA